MNRLGILVDVSHLSDGGFDDVAEISRKPFVASHSNARAVTNQPRNLSDPMLKKLADRGGVTGLNLVPEFLNDRNLPGTVAMLVEHARHIVRVAGEDVLGIGSDLDGFSGLSEISCASQIVLLFSTMEKGIHAQADRQVRVGECAARAGRSVAFVWKPNTSTDRSGIMQPDLKAMNLWSN